MSLISSMFGQVPGMGTVVESFEQAFGWGPYPRYYTGAYIGTGASDPTNSPTYELRMGLVMGQQIATGQWVNYAPTNTDGSEVAKGVLVQNLRMQDILTGANLARFYGIMVSGGVQGAKLIGLDRMARVALSANFIFDDLLPGSQWFLWERFQTKTANYTIVAADNYTLFDNTGATGAVTLTLPPIANGYYFGFRGVAAQNFAVTSNEGGNIIALGNAVANTVTLQTGGQIVGGVFVVYSNPAGTKWIVENRSSATLTIS